MDSSFQVDSLFKNAWSRYTKRIGSVILTGLLSFGIGIATVLGIGLVVGLLILLIVLLKSPLLYLLFIPVGIGLWLLLWYVSAWITLTAARVMTDEYTTQGPWKNFQEVMPMTVNFMVVGLVTGLFMIGLWFTYLLIVPLILWMVWLSFSTFVYLDEKKGGMYPLWRSRELSRGKLLAVLGRILLLWLVVFSTMFLLQLSRNLAPLAILVQLLLLQPFSMAYLYEMYKSLKMKKQPTGNPKSMVWIVLSVVGWVLLVLFIVGSVSAIGGVMKNVDMNKMMQQIQTEQKKQQMKPAPSQLKMQELPEYDY